MKKTKKRGFRKAGFKIARSAKTGRFVTTIGLVNKPAPVTSNGLSDEKLALMKATAVALERRFKSSMKILA